MENIREISSCEVCNNKKLKTVLNLGNLPLCDDLIPISSNKICSEYPTEILFCDICKTAHHKYQVDKELLFPETYHYRARYPNDYIMDQGLKVTKFERNYQNSLTYNFVRAFPLSVSSMPLTYEASSLLKVSVSMSYIRYYLGRGINPTKNPPPPLPTVPEQTQQNNKFFFDPNLNLDLNLPQLNAPNGVNFNDIGAGNIPFSAGFGANLA